MELVLETPKSVRLTFKTTNISVLNFIIFQGCHRLLLGRVNNKKANRYSRGYSTIGAWPPIIIRKPTDTMGTTSPLIIGVNIPNCI